MVTPRVLVTAVGVAIRPPTFAILAQVEVATKDAPPVLNLRRFVARFESVNILFDLATTLPRHGPSFRTPSA